LLDRSRSDYPGPAPSIINPSPTPARWKGRRARAIAAEAPHIQAMSAHEFDAEYGRIYALWREADLTNNGLNRERYKRELTQLAEARWRQ
jgi:hypothetical protein